MDDAQHEYLIRLCYDRAQQAARNGDEPFGALLARDGEVLLTAVNSVHSDDDITRHAEMNLITEATRRFAQETLAQCMLYTSTEPCAMCTGAIYAAGVPTIVFGCSAAALYDLVGSDLAIPSRDILALGRRHTAVLGPFLEEEGLGIHRAYWL